MLVGLVSISRGRVNLATRTHVELDIHRNPTTATQVAP